MVESGAAGIFLPPHGYMQTIKINPGQFWIITESKEERYKIPNANEEWQLSADEHITAINCSLVRSIEDGPFAVVNWRNDRTTRSVDVGAIIHMSGGAIYYPKERLHELLCKEDEDNKSKNRVLEL